MVHLNFEKADNKILKTLNNWKNIILTPIGRITVIKTFLLSSLNHLFMALPNPPNSFINNINQLFFKFIWGQKPDKIKRTQICKTYQKGGLNMIDINLYITSLKTTWIRRLLQSPICPWIDLFNDTIFPTRNLSILGSSYPSSFCKNIKNLFWKDVFEAWLDVSRAFELKCSHDLTNSPLWLNPNLGEYTLHFPNWKERGINLVGDVINKDTGNMYTFQELSNRYNIHPNILDYHRLKIIILKIKRVSNLDLNNLPLDYSPVLPSHLKILWKHKKGAQDMYRQLTNMNNIIPRNQEKWSNFLNLIIDCSTWTDIYKACFNTVLDTNLI